MSVLQGSALEESALEEDDGLTSIFERVDKSLSEALEAFAGFDNIRAEKLLRQMEPLAQSARWVRIRNVPGFT
jgi:hypothetical protein